MGRMNLFMTMSVAKKTKTSPVRNSVSVVFIFQIRLFGIDRRAGRSRGADDERCLRYVVACELIR